jgi:hypothetical protein
MNVTVAGHPEFKTLDTAVALSLLVVAIDLLWSLPGGLWYLLRFKTPRPSSATAGGVVPEGPAFRGDQGDGPL